MADFAGQTNLEVFYARLDVEEMVARYRATVPRKLVKRAEKGLAKARTKDSMQALDKLTHEVDGEPRITRRPPADRPGRATSCPTTGRRASPSGRTPACASTGAPSRPTAAACWSATEFVDLARKVVGVGSVGTRAWIALMLGRDRRDPLFLQIKEAQPSVLEEFAGRSDYRNAGHRVVSGQRLMQAASDIFLGWLHVTDGLDGGERDFYVRQLRDWKGSAEIEAMVPKGMRIYAEMCGWTLARAHARSGDPVAIAAYLGKKRRLRPGHRRVLGAPTPTRTSATTSPEGGRRRRPAHGRGGSVMRPSMPNPPGGQVDEPARSQQAPDPQAAVRGVANRTLDGSQPDWEAIGHVDAPDGAPNVLLVLIDDAGFGNAGTFGGPIDTPNYTRIAQEGVRYNRFHVTALCSPTRAALLTGRNSHAVGFGSVGEFSTGFPGYTAFVPDDCVPFPRILRDNGYSTAAFGKWHLTPDGQQGPAGPFDRWPVGWGFDYFYGFLGGGSGQWDPCLTENQKIIGTPDGVLRRGEPVLPARRHGGQDDRVAARDPGAGRRRSRSSPTSRPAAATPRTTCPRSGRRSTRASSTRAGTSCARRRSPGRRRSA